MITLNYPQRSIDWITARLWRLTASRMSTVITSTGKLSRSEAALGAIDKLIAGIALANVMNARANEIDGLDDWQLADFMANFIGDSFKGNRHTRRGEDCEPDALAALAAKIGMEITEVGMCVMGDCENGVVSCSPDGLIYQARKLIAGAEVKSPCLAVYYGQVARGTLPDDYKLQVHSSMAICEVDTWHFCSYFAGRPLFHVEVKRDAFTDTVERSLIEFRDVYAARYEIVTEALATLGKEAA
jgi:hypothetical protein